ncbi:hypothetical protein TGAM01_v206346 [Trichoderma gamsii]|uniref:Uncharacterized protein n=1 Tax=Trichoderma gamsii TaxID=398673 RepID=A0A2P4ZKN1_9HYPO|nr:hypothetical protein TGAM01_v206346 [Trichoderma gamsii]PON24838.1 hypothetical protein TGAM01_v206346 [Trichoderma gamsii]
MMFPVELLKASYFSTATDQALFYLSSFRPVFYISDQRLQLFTRILTFVTIFTLLFLVLSLTMQLGSSLETPEVTKVMNQGGTNYVELIKNADLVHSALANLQFLYGRDVPIEILSQVTPPDTWQVTVLKTEDGIRSIAITESGEGFTNVLKKAHYQSGELLTEFACDPTQDNSTLGRREALQVDIATSVADMLTGRNKESLDGKVPEGKASDDPAWKEAFDNARKLMGPNDGDPPRLLAADIRWINELNRKKLDDFYAKNPHKMPKGGPSYTLLPEPAESGDSSSTGIAWHSRPRINPSTNAQITTTASSTSAESSVQGAASAAAVPVSPQQGASKSYREALNTRMHSQAMARRMAPNKKRQGIVLYINLSGCGEAVVADECQLSGALWRGQREQDAGRHIYAGECDKVQRDCQGDAGQRRGGAAGPAVWR